MTQSQGIFRSWRLVATGVSFLLFGVGGLLLGYLVFPLIALLSPTRQMTVRRCRYLVHLCFRGFVHFMCLTGVISWEVEGREQLRGAGRLVVANHPSLIDIVFLISMIPNATCIVKAQLYRNAFTRGPLKWAGYVPNNTPDQLLDDGEAELNNGATVVVFPEGTRSTQTEIHRFRRGAAYLWLRSRCPLTLVSISSTPSILTKEQKWYDIPAVRPHFRLIARDQDQQLDTDIEQGARAVTRQWQHYFTQEITT